MFSKALFKQSCKANGTMWAIITAAVCFMLACVMLISGSDNIGSTITAVEDTIINREIESALETRAIGYYENQTDGMHKFDAAFATRLQEQLIQNPENAQGAITTAYAAAVNDVQQYVLENALKINPSYTAESSAAQEMLGSVMYAINPAGKFDGFYTEHGEPVPESYDVASIAASLATGKAEEYVNGKERAQYINGRSQSCAAIFLAGNITLQENVDKIIAELGSFGVTHEKYDSFGYNYANVKEIASETVITYRSLFASKIAELDKKLASGELTQSQYSAEALLLKAELTGDISSSLLASLPTEVSSALEEIGKLDLYSLVVGSVFYKLAGLLLPIIFMIMASNNLIAGQVDSGSMAYVLSTSTKRETVAVTQAAYLISSLLAMFALTTITGCICLGIVKDKVALTFGNLILLNVGAFLVLFALSGLCFFTSCYFDRSKRSMAVGGGLSIFALVAAMLGLFGSPVIPQVVRLDALNNFNYVTVITLFDAVSIIDGSLAFLWKFFILLGLGVLGYILGSVKFTKKDLPL